MDKVNKEIRRLLNQRFTESLVTEVTCRLCGQPRHLLEVNDQFAFYVHHGDELKKCHAIGWRTSFLKEYYAYMKELVKRNTSAIESVKVPVKVDYIPTDKVKIDPDYPMAWERSFKDRAETFMRGEPEEKRGDRRWLYEHLQGPVLDIGCGNAIDYEGFKNKGYVGIDITPSFLESAVKDYGVPSECLTLCDARKIPFRDRQFKSAYMKDLLLHYPTEEGFAFIDEMLRVAEDCYVSWGGFGDRTFLPTYNPRLTVMSDADVARFGEGEKFYYNSPDLTLLEKRYKVTFIKGTTITKVEKI